MLRFDDFAHGAAHHDLAELDVGGVRLAFRHAAAHVGIEREVNGPAQDLPVGGHRNRRIDDLEITRLRLADRTTLQQHSTVHVRRQWVPSRADCALRPPALQPSGPFVMVRA
jgi:hypothetical protein